MKKTTNLTVTTKGGTAIDATVTRVQGYDETTWTMDGGALEGKTTEYHDYAELTISIASVGIKGNRGSLEGDIISTYRTVGKTMQRVRVQLNENDAATIASLMAEILAPEDKAHNAKVETEVKEDDARYEAHCKRMNDAMTDKKNLKPTKMKTYQFCISRAGIAEPIHTTDYATYEEAREHLIDALASYADGPNCYDFFRTADDLESEISAHRRMAAEEPDDAPFFNAVADKLECYRGTPTPFVLDNNYELFASAEGDGFEDDGKYYYIRETESID